MSEFGTTLLIVGAEDLLVARQVDQRVQAARRLRSDAELIDLGPGDLADGRLAEALGGSLFATASIVVVRDLSALPPEQEDLLVRAAGDPGDELCLTLAHPGGARGKALLARLAKAGVQQIDIKPVKPYQLPDFVRAEAKTAKLRLDAAAATALIDAVGVDLPALASAVAQLASDWPGAQLNVELVNRYFAGRAEVSGFAISDAVMSGQSQQALHLLRWGFDTGLASQLVTSALASSLRATGKYLGLKGRRLGEAEMAAAIGVPPWKVKDVAATARGWTSAGVASAISAVAQADAQVKGASTDPEYALERMVLRLGQIRSGMAVV